MYTQFGEVTRD